MAEYNKWYNEMGRRSIYATKLPTKLGAAGKLDFYTIIVWKPKGKPIRVLLSPQYAKPEKWVVDPLTEKDQKFLSQAMPKIKKEVIRQLEL